MELIFHLANTKYQQYRSFIQFGTKLRSDAISFKIQLQIRSINLSDKFYDASYGLISAKTSSILRCSNTK